jgi:hypothetical protein
MKLLSVFAILSVGFVGHIQESSARQTPDGSWKGFLVIDSVGHPRRRLTANRLEVSLKLEIAPPRSVENMQILNPTHVGIARGNFGVLESGLPKSSYPLVAALRTHDSLVVAINPSFDHGAVRLVGRLQGAVYRGNWSVTSYGRGIEGHFELRQASGR